MTRPIAILIGVVVGLGVGLLSERVPVRPVLQSIMAALAGAIVAFVVSVAVWVLRPPPEGVFSVSFGLSEVLVLWLGLFIGGAALLHVAIGWIGDMLHPSIGIHRRVLLALLSSMSAAVYMSEPLRAG
jgi:hypothetical protein